ncbi:MAG TPA: protein kinase [Gemmataceae bacterium]|jgi:serine/threonine protein kinase|nr:protein kinase [Gemmataceae bacterium]
MKERLPETLNTPSNEVRPVDATVSPIAPLLVDQQNRWQKGERVLVETYIAQQPSLQSDSQVMLGLIANEIIIRQRKGEDPPAEEYRQRFPQFASALELHFADNKTGADLAFPKTLPLDKPTLDSGKQPTVVAPPHADAAPGYEIREVLGRGGMGVVYKAWQRSLNRMVALKMILAGSHAGSEDVLRFRIEAESAARLQHPNITQIHEVGEANGRPFFAMEYIPGSSLADELDGTPQPPRVAAELIEILARAMQHAHERGIVHRDLKPANIMLMESAAEPGFTTSLGQPKITDFGLAKRLDADLRQTQTGAVLGTPSYMSPEQAAGNISAIGPCTDIYALGAILYDMLTGRPPFKSNTLADTLHQVQAMEPVSPGRLEPNVPRDLETICLKCLRKEPARRYPSALALATDLRRYLNGEPIQARPTPTWERIVKWSKRRPAAAALIVVSVLSAVGLLMGGSWSYVQIRDALKREEKQHQMADASFRDALNAVNQMLMQVGAVDLADVPQMEPVRKKLLAQAQSFMQKFLSERGDDPSVRLEAGRMYVYKADVEDMLGNVAVAEEDYGRAISYLSPATEDTGANDEARKALGLAYNNLGKLLKKTNRFQDAQAALQQALGVREKLAGESADPDRKRDLATTHYWLGVVVAELPRKQKEAQEEYERALALQEPLAQLSPEDQRAQAQTLTNLGNLLRPTNALQAEEAYRKADHVQQELADKYPAVPGYRRQLARSHHNLAVMLWLGGRYVTAEELFSQAFKILDDLISHFPEVPEYKKEAVVIHRSKGDLLRLGQRFDKAEQEFQLAFSIINRLVADSPGVPDYRRMQGLLFTPLAGLLESTKRPIEARKAFDQALNIQERLIAEFPKVAEYQGDLAITRLNLGKVLFQRFRRNFATDPNDKTTLDDKQMISTVTEASRSAREAIAHYLAALKSNPNNLKYRSELVLAYQLLLDALLALRQQAEAAQAATELVDAFPEDYGEYLIAAVCLARCAAQASGDKRFTDQQRKELAEDYAKKAVDFIRRAILKGFKNYKELKNSSSYDVLRDREDFKKLLRDLEETQSAVG